MKLSIVTTLYQSAEYVEEFYSRATDIAKKIAGDNYEIIMVNDGSPDDSLDLAVQISAKDYHLSVVDLSRNFGHHKAMMTGLSFAEGDKVFLLDSDLEEEPEWLERFEQQMKLMDCDVVYGVQKTRKGGVAERWSGEIFYRLFRKITGLALPNNIVTSRLMTRRYVKSLLDHKEREIFLAGLWFITGFDQQPVLISKHHTSETTYNIRHKLSILVNSITSFSNKPLISIFYVGVLIASIASLYILYLIVNRVFLSVPLSGWTSVMASIWLLGGIIITFIGIIGIYLSKVFSETKQRPYTIVRQVYNKPQSSFSNKREKVHLKND